MHNGPAMRGPHGTVPMAGHTKHSFSSTWGKLITYCRPWIPAIIIALIFAMSGTVFTILGPDKISEMTDIITNGLLGSIDMDAVTTVALTLVAFYASSILLSYAQSFIMATVTQKVSKSMRRDISKKINVLPLKYFDSTSYGDILSRVTNDVDTIGQTLNQSIGNLVSAIALLVGSVFMMFKTNWILAIVAIGASLIGFVLMMFIISHSQKFFTRQQKLVGDINGHVEEVYSGPQCGKSVQRRTQSV